MQPRKHHLKNGVELEIRQAIVQDAGAVLDYVHAISAESDFLTFGPGEFELTEAEEQLVLQEYLDTGNRLYLLGLVGDTIVGSLTFSAGRRPRVRHIGELGMSVQKEYWGLGIGSLLLETLVDWARGNGIVTKINLRVRTDNQRAIALYGRKGFTLEGTIRRGILLDGKYYDLHWMGLEL
jgi:RimJ/RimL family protein N-acetyltransferase